MTTLGTIDLSRTRDREQRTDGHLDNYIGHRAKIGVIIPSTISVIRRSATRTNVFGCPLR